MNEEALRLEYLKLRNEEYLKKNPNNAVNFENELIPIVPINPNKRQGFIYIRVSTGMQVQYGHSLETQLATLTKYCNNNNIQILRKFEDAGISGKNMNNRPNLMAMLNALQPGYVVVVTAVSRLSRTTYDLFSITTIIKKAKTELILLDL